MGLSTRAQKSAGRVGGSQTERTVTEATTAMTSPGWSKSLVRRKRQHVKGQASQEPVMKVKMPDRDTPGNA